MGKNLQTVEVVIAADRCVVVAPPLISVVIPTRDRWGMLRATLATVLAQRDVDLEVVVVDDGSSTAPAHFPGDPRLRLLRHETSSGVAEARNAGLAAARGPFVAFTDDDDLWAPDKLAAQLRAIEATGASWASCGAVVVDNELRIQNNQRASESGDVGSRILATNVVPGGGSGVLADTALVRRVGGFDPSFHMVADWDLWIRLGLAAPVAAVDRPLLVYRMHTGGMSWRHDHTYDELRALEEKYAAQRAARGVAMDWPRLEYWLGDRKQRAGDRVGAARSFLRAERGHRPTPLDQPGVGSLRVAGGPAVPQPPLGPARTRRVARRGRHLVGARRGPARRGHPIPDPRRGRHPPTGPIAARDRLSTRRGRTPVVWPARRAQSADVAAARHAVVDVVICTYDNAAGLDRTLTALGRSRPAEGRWGVLVVDNNSTDDTQEVVQRHRLSGALPSLSCVREPRQGLTWARLRGVTSTTAPWIAFVDDDCTVDEHWVERTVAFARDHPEAGGFGGRVVLCHEADPGPVVAGYGWAFAEQDLGDDARPVDCLVGAGMVLNRSALEASGWTDGPLLSDRVGKRLVSGGDVELALRVASTGRPLWYVPDCEIRHEIPMRRTVRNYLVRIIVGLGISHSFAMALTWGGLRRSWAVAAVRQAGPPFVDLLRRVRRVRRGPDAQLDALLAASFEWGRWVGIVRVAVLVVRGRCTFFGQAAPGRDRRR